jgi:hypothetical protein
MIVSHNGRRHVVDVERPLIIRDKRNLVELVTAKSSLNLSLNLAKESGGTYGSLAVSSLRNRNRRLLSL